MPKQNSGTLRGDADGGWENGCRDRSAHVRPVPHDGAGGLGHGAGRRCRCRHTARDRRAARSGGCGPPPLRLDAQAAHRGLQAGLPARHGAGCGPGRRQGVRARPAALRQSGHLDLAGDDAQRDRAALRRPGPAARLRLQPPRGGAAPSGPPRRPIPSCAMCYWGEAYVLGPNINYPMVPDAVEPAFAAIAKAQALAASASPKEQALIRALAKRYAPDPAADRKALDVAYADAMTEVAGEFGDDDNVQVLFADALMNLSPWDYWAPDGVAPEGAHGRASSRRWRRCWSAARTMPGAIHLYIHTVEASTTPRAGGALRRPAGRPAPRCRPPRPHAGAHLLSGRPLQGFARRQHRGGQGRRGTISRTRSQGTSTRRSTTRITSTSCWSRLRWAATAGRRSRPRTSSTG